MARGCIIKRGDRYVIKYRDANDKQRWKTIGSNKKEAERALVEIMRHIHRGDYQELREITFADFASKWLSDYAEGRVRPSTYKFYRDIIRLHLTPYFGGFKLTSITAHLVEQYLSTKRRETELSPTTIGYHLRLLKMLFKKAVIWGYLVTNPAEYITGLKVERKEMDFLSVEELRLFLQNVNRAYYPLFLTAALTGMRRGELLALRWSDINWSTGQIHVRRSMVLGNFEKPKSRAGIRAIIMPPVLISVLKRHRLACPVSELNLVFCNRDGKPLHFENVYKRQFLPALRRAGLRQIRFHDLRHTYTSLLIAQGENLKFIQHQLGHSSAQVTLDRYGHLMPEVQHGAGERLQNTVFGDFGSNLVAEAGKNKMGSAPLGGENPAVKGKIGVGPVGFEPTTNGL